MNAVVLGAALASVLIFAIACPLYFRKKFRSHPALGITLWIAASIGLLVSLVIAVSIGIISVVETYLSLASKADGDQDLLIILVVSFIPWVGLAGTGILIALISMRLEPMIKTARRAEEQLNIFDSTRESFRGVQVLVLPIDAPIAFAKKLEGVGKIVVSTKTKSLLTTAELEAVLMHEIQHLRRNHLVLKKITGRISSWLPWLIFATAIHSELHELLELDADKSAAKLIDLTELDRARSKFFACL